MSTTNPQPSGNQDGAPPVTKNRNVWSGGRAPAPPRLTVKLTNEVDHLLGRWSGMTGLSKGQVGSMLLDELILKGSFEAAMQAIVLAIDENRELRRAELENPVKPEDAPPVANGSKEQHP